MDLNNIPYNPFQIPQQRLHFFKKYCLSDYPPKSSFDYGGLVFMAIYVDDTEKIVSNWPLNLKFIPKDYSPESYILLYYFDADTPPKLYTREVIAEHKVAKWIGSDDE
jgi:hypothetical protein